ncbi:hypothetical protein [Candidatus Spongiihabitans sp.]|uniref:hypothetical protein n=1 Tax=Candidatus Spongiihabitans sp. TaxID=3101308 RepID=UPI003C7CF2E4
MKKRISRLLISSAIVLFISFNVYAQNTPIERDAIFTEGFDRSVIDTLVTLVRLHGYRCDSVSAARPFVFSRGFSITCNGFAYEYEIEDKGGTWTVTLD